MGTFIRPPSGPPAYTLANLPGAPGMNTTPGLPPGSYTGIGGVRQGIADTMPPPSGMIPTPTGGIDRRLPPVPAPAAPVPQGPVTAPQAPVKGTRRSIADLLAQVQGGGG